MALAPLTPTDTRFLFRPVSTDLVALLRTLPPAAFDRPTIAGRWTVRDVLAHLVDLMFRRLSFHRDRMAPPPPPREIASERDFVEFINWVNAGWIDAARRFSPRVLTDLFEKASADLADWFERLPLDAPALFGVSWAGEQTSEGWFDVGREFVEVWHHQEQIRLAVGAASLADPRFLQAMLAIAVRALPHAYRDVPAEEGATVLLDVSGPAAGQWTLKREGERWTLYGGAPDRPSATVRMSDATAWRLFCNALKEEEWRKTVTVEGRKELAQPLAQARAVIV